MDKQARHIFIKEQISKHKIGQQEDLLKRLIAKGEHITQATLSRDLKELKIGRIVDTQYGYVYVLPENSTKTIPLQISTDSDSIISIAFSNNLCVLKTQTGYAAAIALKIDNMQLDEIIGTIAGDDTILIIPKDGVKKQGLTRILQKFIPQLKHIL